MGQSGSLLESQARNGETHTSPHPQPGWEDRKLGGEEMEIHTGKTYVQGLAQATMEGEEPKGTPSVSMKGNVPSLPESSSHSEDVFLSVK
jgi:hypothetical protein